MNLYSTLKCYLNYYRLSFFYATHLKVVLYFIVVVLVLYGRVESTNTVAVFFGGTFSCPDSTLIPCVP